MAIYVKIGDKIKGNIEAKGHEDWTDATSIQWGVGRGIHSATGTSKDREASAPSISEVTITKLLDHGSPKIFTEVCTGKSILVEIHLVKTDADQLQSYLEYKLENCLLSGYSISSGGDRPSETVSFNFTKIEMKYIPWKEDHTKDSQIVVSYDTATATSKA